MKPFSIGLFTFYFLLNYFNIFAQVSEKAVNDFLNDSAVRTGHAGISIYDPASKEYLYNYNADKNFMPSSNVKLFTLYAGLKYLGDSIAAANIFETADSVYFESCGDPTFLHPDFTSQPFVDFLRSSRKKISLALTAQDQFKKYGSGWAWDDAQEDFMPERSRFPVYGNVFTFSLLNGMLYSIPPRTVISKYFSGRSRTDNGYFKISRSAFDFDFQFYFIKSDKKFQQQQIPFPTDRLYTDQIRMLADTLKIGEHNISIIPVQKKAWKKLYSRPVDSLFRPMMFNSDNFFAEQTLLMVSNERFGYMNDEQIIDSLLKNDLKDIPNEPRWVDGSGLSRYNLFSPKDFIYILDKLRTEFGWQRIKNILPTAGEGTLKNYYETAKGNIYAKSGSMSNNVSLSGYLITQKKRTLFFSVMINNFSGKAAAGRRAIEKLLLQVRETN